jgi:hypothetical protein
LREKQLLQRKKRENYERKQHSIVKKELIAL